MPQNQSQKPADPFEDLPLGQTVQQNGSDAPTPEPTDVVAPMIAEPALEGADGALVTLAGLATSKSAERWIQGMTTLRNLSIRECRPGDFIKKQTSTGQEVVDLVASGARKIMSTMLIESLPDEEPQLFLEEDGTRTAYVIGDGMCWINRMRARRIYAARNEQEEYVGRKVRTRDDGSTISTEAIAIADLKKAARKVFDRMVVEALLGIGTIPADELQSVYGINPELVPEGHGFGTSDERRAQTVAEPGVKEKAEKLWEALMQITGGALEEARSLLREITRGSKPNPRTGHTFAGHDSVGRMTQLWQVESAISRLKQRPEFINFYQEHTNGNTSQ